MVMHEVFFDDELSGGGLLRMISVTESVFLTLVSGIEVRGPSHTTPSFSGYMDSVPVVLPRVFYKKAGGKGVAWRALRPA